MNKKIFLLIVVFLILGLTFVGAGCDKSKNKNEADSKDSDQSDQDFSKEMEAGESAALTNGKLALQIAGFDDHKVRYYNTVLPNGKKIYFFVLEDNNGIYRAAANACQVCFASKTGFHQEGNLIVCNTCGNKYPLEKIATEKGGCNPGPINPDIKVKGGKIEITQAELEQVADLF
ncbi:MAG: hypothetical protein ACD_63C00060G0006 [uncultured bacterium]|nr:MAG: hypothetical protein ACD_63C00060G0006 [uncultured bacterium]